MDKNTEIEKVAQRLEAKMMDKYGPVITGKDLVEVLGFSSTSALRQANLDGRIPIPIFSPEFRRGKSALTSDVAYWLAEISETARSNMSENNLNENKEVNDDLTT